MKPNITLISANFYPEDTAIGFFSSQMVDFLKNNNNQPTVISGFPYYPQWEIYHNYKDKPSFIIDIFNEIPVYRSKQFVPKRPTFFSRVRMMLSFLKGSIVNYRKIEKCDVVIVIVPFSLSIITGILLAKKHKAKLWIHIQDFEFDLAFESGILSKKNILTSFFHKAVLKFESYLFNRADIISSISNNMLVRAKSKSSVNNYYLFPNWISEKQISNTDEIHQYIDKNKFTLLYSGNIGDKQNWSFFIKVCKEIERTNLEVNVVIVGNGAFANNLKEMIKPFSFVKMYEPVPLDELGKLLNSADAHFLFQKTDVLDSVMPSKIMAMMASKRPSIITGHKNSEVATIFNKNNIGYYFSSENEEKIIDTLRELMNDKSKSEILGKNAYEYIINNFEEKTILGNMNAKLKSILNE